jgi:EAL domain-containing protein (putative c-di-GMP-specific phosphodiesterase class I)
MTTTAEGIETNAQLALLRSIGCVQVQGYLIGKPKPLQEIAELAGSSKSYAAS